MNPEDKYLNPRPAPKPALGGLNTLALQRSAPHLEVSSANISTTSGRSRHSRNASLPSSAVSLRTFRLPRKGSMDARGRSTSPAHNKPTGLRAAFRQLAPTKASIPEAKVERGRAGFPGSHGERLSSGQPRRSDQATAYRLEKPASPASAALPSRNKSPSPSVNQDPRQAQTKPLALRRSIDQLDNSEAGFLIPSFQNHRRQGSRSREPFPLRNSLLSPEKPEAESTVRDASLSHYQALETLREVVSAQNTPIWPSSGIDILINKPTRPDSIPGASDKRLPTLPSTPSPADPPTERSRTPHGDIFQGLEGLESSLAEATITDEYPSSTDRSHFSHWTGTTASSFSSSQWSSVFLDGKSPSFSQKTGPLSQPTSPWEMTCASQSLDAVMKQKGSPPLDADRMPSIISSSTISSYDNTSPSSPISERSDSVPALKDEPTSLQKRYGMMPDSFQGYKLPVDTHDFESTPKYYLPCSTDGRPQDSCRDRIGDVSLQRSPSDDLTHTTNIQQLINELSYLGDLIQR
jgi:hypothetical protein